MASVHTMAELAGLTTRDVTASGERRAVAMTRTLRFPIEDTWDAITDPDRLQRWIGSVSGDLREGGDVELRMSDEHIARLTVLRCDAPRRLSLQWRWPGEEDSVVDVVLRSLADGVTELSLRHVRLSDHTAVQYGAGWEDFLVRLGDSLTDREVDGRSLPDVSGDVEPIWREQADGAVAAFWPSIDVQPAGTTVEVEHQIAATASSIWAAITDAPTMDRWFATITGDLTVGGSWQAVFDNGSAHGVVGECVPQQRFTTTWAWDHDVDLPPSTLTIELTEVDGGTNVSLRQTGVMTPARGYSAGWFAFLRALDQHTVDGEAVREDWQTDWELAMSMLRD